MKIVVAIAALIIFFFLWLVFDFLKYQGKERLNKNKVFSYLQDGLSLAQALKLALSNLNKNKALNLSDSIIERISSDIASLGDRMDVRNVVDVFSDFIYRYIFYHGKYKNPKNLSEEKIIYALETLELQDRGGYYVIKPDMDRDEFRKKYSN